MSVFEYYFLILYCRYAVERPLVSDIATVARAGIEGECYQAFNFRLPDCLSEHDWTWNLQALPSSNTLSHRQFVVLLILSTPFIQVNVREEESSSVGWFTPCTSRNNLPDLHLKLKGGTLTLESKYFVDKRSTEGHCHVAFRFHEDDRIDLGGTTPTMIRS